MLLVSVSARDCDAIKTRLLTVLSTFSSLSVASDSVRVINDISISSGEGHLLPLDRNRWLVSICCWRRNPIGDMVEERLNRFILRDFSVDKKGEFGKDFCSLIRLANRFGTSHLFFPCMSRSIFKVSIDDNEVAVDTSWYSLAPDQRLSWDRWLLLPFLPFRPCLKWIPHLL